MDEEDPHRQVQLDGPQAQSESLPDLSDSSSIVEGVADAAMLESLSTPFKLDKDAVMTMTFGVWVQVVRLSVAFILYWIV